MLVIQSSSYVLLLIVIDDPTWLQPLFYELQQLAFALPHI